MILEAYTVSEKPQPLVPAPAPRDWMEAFSQRHAYRCLPLAVANTYGWQLLLPVDQTAEWNGGLDLTDVTVHCARPCQAISNFKCGILTFDVAYIFRTSPFYHLLVTGPSDTFKDVNAPLTAIIEADRLPCTFTFNYQVTRPGRVHWQAGEPYAQLYVVQAGLQEKIQPVIGRLRDDPQLRRQITKYGGNVEPISGRVSQRAIRKHLNRPGIKTISWHRAESEAVPCSSPCDEE